MLDIYNFVISILGSDLPIELEFLIPIGCILVILIVLLVFISPFLLIFYLCKR